MSNDVNKIHSGEKIYELEIDYSTNDIKADKLKQILSEVELIKKVMVESDYLIKKDEENIVVKYKNLVYGSNNLNFNNLYSMHPISVEVQHIIDYIPNKYSVTDKSDGEKCVIFISNNKINYISNNLNVKQDNNLKVKDLNDTVFEGEYIYLENEKKYVFMIYDYLFFKGKDIRNESKLELRYSYIYKLLDQLYPKKYYKIKPYNGNYNITNIKKHYRDEINPFMIVWIII